MIRYIDKGGQYERKFLSKPQSIADSTDTANTGTVFQIAVRMKTVEDVTNTYEILKEGSRTNVPIGPIFFSPCMVDFVDKFEVRWCLFAE